MRGEGRTGGPGSPRGSYQLHLVRGCLGIAFGLVVLIAGTGLSQLATFAALYSLGAGAVTLRWVLAHRGARGRRLSILVATIWVCVAVALLLHDAVGALVGEGVLLDFLGAVAIAVGVLRLFGRFHDDPFAGAHPRPRYRYVLGPLDVVLGAMVIAAEGESSLGIRITFGLWGLVSGAFLLTDAAMLRRAGRGAAVRR